jgi:hypothetical protein
MEAPADQDARMVGKAARETDERKHGAQETRSLGHR